MSQVATWTDYSGLLIPGTMKKHPDIKYVFNPGTTTEKTYYMYTYNLKIPFEPTENPEYDNITFMDAHGNEYNKADNIICAKLDIAMLWSDANQASLINVLPKIDGIGATLIGAFNVGQSRLGIGARPFYKIENDFFDEFEYTPLLNGTDGWNPWDITKPASLDLMPFPVWLNYSSNSPATVSTLRALKTLTEDSNTPSKMGLLKLNTPLYFEDSRGYALNRLILYGKPFLG